MEIVVVALELHLLRTGKIKGNGRNNVVGDMKTRKHLSLERIMFGAGVSPLSHPIAPAYREGIKRYAKEYHHPQACAMAVISSMISK